jgi:hypothetical protein
MLREYCFCDAAASTSLKVALFMSSYRLKNLRNSNKEIRTWARFSFSSYSRLKPAARWRVLWRAVSYYSERLCCFLQSRSGDDGREMDERSRGDEDGERWEEGRRRRSRAEEVLAVVPALVSWHPLLEGVGLKREKRREKRETTTTTTAPNNLSIRFLCLACCSKLLYCCVVA